MHGADTAAEALRAKRPAMERRARLAGAVRAFFRDGGFLEVETPVRVAAPATERHIDAEPSGSRWLRTSPELHMKRLLAAGCDRIFQLGPCFRAGERGAHHHPEYTMLEWYRAGAGYLDMLEDAARLLRRAAGETFVYRGRTVRLAPPWEVVPVSEAFRRHAGWDPAEAWDEDRFDVDLVDKVEPALPRDAPAVLIDYPAPAAALARLKPGDALRAERWELYVAGIELANAYTELTDPAEQRARFAACAQARAAAGKPAYPLDEAFLAALARMPPAGGVALGFDRLAMLLADAPSLDGVIAFRE